MAVARFGRITALVAVAAAVAACSSGSPARQPSRTPTSSVAQTVSPSSSTPTTVAPATVSTGRATTSAQEQPAATLAAPAPTTTSTPRPRTSAAARHSSAAAHRLPLGFATGSATQVITVVAPSHGSTTATLQAWRRSGSGWYRVGTSVTAHVGSDGLSSRPSETRSASPIGSFTLTQAFGHDPDPGTALPYTHTTPSDWWISQPGPLYNTRQRCSSGCSFTHGDPNEHLYYETPYYDHAVVIDYNTRNAPGGVRAGAGSAFFLHVTDGAPTAGCVAIAPGELVRLMRWLTPAAHPRIVLGVA